MKWGCDRPRLPPDADSAMCALETAERRRLHAPTLLAENASLVAL
jgi:hypothetical protein